MRRIILIPVCAATAFLGWHLGKTRLTAKVDPGPPDGSPPVLTGAAPEKAMADSKPILSEKTDALLAEVTSSAKLAEIGPKVLEFARTLEGKDFPSAIAAARTSKNSYAGKLAALLEGYWAEVDLDAAKAWMFSASRQMISSEIVDTWARQRPAEMLDWFELLSEEDKRRHTEMLASAIAYTAGYSDPARAARILAEAPRRDVGSVDYNSNAMYINGLFERWTNRAPQAAARCALSLPAGNARTTAVLSVIREWTRTDPAAARGWMEALPDAVLAARAVSVHGAVLAVNDPRGAAMYLATQQQTSENTKSLRSASEAWGSKEFDAALAWSRTLSNQESLRTVCSGLITGLAQKDVDKAARTLLEEPSLLAGDGTRTVTLAYLAVHGMDAAFEFVEKLPDQYRTFGRGYVLDGTASKSPQLLEDWARTQPEGEERKQALLRLVGAQVNTAPTMLEKWVRGLPPGPSRDAVIKRSIQLSPRGNWDQLAAVVSLASDSGPRREFLEQLKRFGPRSWVTETSFLSAEEKAQILAVSKNP